MAEGWEGRVGVMLIAYRYVFHVSGNADGDLVTAVALPLDLIVCIYTPPISRDLFWDVLYCLLGTPL